MVYALSGKNQIFVRVKCIHFSCQFSELKLKADDTNAIFNFMILPYKSQLKKNESSYVPLYVFPQFGRKSTDIMFIMVRNGDLYLQVPLWYR